MCGSMWRLQFKISLDVTSHLDVATDKCGTLLTTDQHSHQCWRPRSKTQQTLNIRPERAVKHCCSADFIFICIYYSQWICAFQPSMTSSQETLPDREGLSGLWNQTDKSHRCHQPRCTADCLLSLHNSEGDKKSAIKGINLINTYRLFLSTRSDLGAAEHDQGLAYGWHTSTDIKGLQNKKSHNEQKNKSSSSPPIKISSLDRTLARSPHFSLLACAVC